MAIWFFDTSALVKRYVNEVGTAWVTALLVPAPDTFLCIAHITAVELVAALARRERVGSLTPGDSAIARSSFRADIADEYQIVEVNEAVISRAMAIAEGHSLRAYDAVQLAAALELNALLAFSGLPLTLVSADTELNTAAIAEGLMVEDPNQHP